LILGVAVMAWRGRQGRGAAVALLGLLVFQALLGRWTVVLGLAPPIVAGHLIGGLAVLAALWWLVLGSFADPGDRSPSGADPDLVRPGWLRSLALVGLALLTVQIALGG
jgi:heme a synthase